MSEKTCREVTQDSIEKHSMWYGAGLSQLLLEHAERIDAINERLEALETPAEPATVAEQKAEGEKFYRWFETISIIPEPIRMQREKAKQSASKKPTSLALGFAAQAWCEPSASKKVMDTELATAFAAIIQPLLDTIESAWEVISNADWETGICGWKVAAEMWRDNQWHRILSGRLPNQSAVGDTGEPHTPSPATSNDTPTAVFPTYLWDERSSIIYSVDSEGSMSCDSDGYCWYSDDLRIVTEDQAMELTKGWRAYDELWPNEIEEQDTPTADYCIKTGPNGLPILPGGSIEKQQAAQITELRATNATLRNRLSEAETIANKKETINTELQAENERLKSDLNLSIFESEKNAISANNWQSSYRANKAMLTEVYKERDALKQRIAELEHLEAAAMLRESEAWAHVAVKRSRITDLEREIELYKIGVAKNLELVKERDNLQLEVDRQDARITGLEPQAAELRRIREGWEKMKKRNSIVAWSQNLYGNIDIEKLINPQPAKAKGE